MCFQQPRGRGAALRRLRLAAGHLGSGSPAPSAAAAVEDAADDEPITVGPLLASAEGPLTPQQVEHYCTFGFVTLPGALLPELAGLKEEHAVAMSETYGDDTPESRQIVRMLRPESPTFQGLPEDCANFRGGFGAIAEQLYGPDIFCCYMEANRYVGNTGWHPVRIAFRTCAQS